MNSNCCTAILVLLASLFTSVAAEGKRETFTLDGAKVSLSPPPKWTFDQQVSGRYSGVSYKRPGEGKLLGSLSISRGNGEKGEPGTVEEAVEVSEKYSKRLEGRGEKILSKSPFSTKSGTKGIKLVTSNPAGHKPGGEILVHCLYFFPDANGKAVMFEALSSEKEWPNIKDTIEASAKSAEFPK